MPESEEWPEGRPEDGEGPATSQDRAASKAVAAERIRRQHLWVDLQVQQAMERGEFDDLPGAGKPIEGLGEVHDPDWWLKKLVEREKISVLPPALALRKEDLELDAVLDRQPGERQVRSVLEDFNLRIVNARRQLEGGPPVITPTRDVDAEVEAWRARRTAKRAAAVARQREADASRRRWWQRRR
ncbi:DnaJ family domain-containing protein [Nocardioides jensenii]|uniref:DnaJ family domain-containing protein n=1 Tax=Nocardioides jensenii TaxID=1843 RepID=UPI000829FF42|nr:DUF1992 domain-containing protein [Nocardioides jensenii]